MSYEQAHTAAAQKANEIKQPIMVAKHNDVYLVLDNNNGEYKLVSIIFPNRRINTMPMAITHQN